MNLKKSICLLFIFLNLQVSGQCFQKISGGEFHTVAIKGDGVIFSWGRNNYGQLGDGTTIGKNVPTQITGSTWQDIAAGSQTSLGIKADGTLWAWGGTNGGGTVPSNVPLQVGTETNWYKVVSRGPFSHTHAIKTNGTLWAWGLNDYSVLGDGSMTARSTPVQIGTATNWQQVAQASVHTAALRTNGTLWAWGQNGMTGTFGNGTTTDSNVPVQIGTDTNWQFITAGSNYTLALKTNGTLWISGYSAYDQAAPAGVNLYIHQHGTANNWHSVSAGDAHNLAIKTDGTLWAWGLNSNGQLGDGTTINRNVPTQIGTDSDWQSVSAGQSHSIAVKNDGTVYTWGYNVFGQLGNGTTVNVNVPTAIPCPATLAVEDLSVANKVIVYPNPVKDVLAISYSGDSSSVSFYDVLGREVLTKAIRIGDAALDVSTLSSGTYFLKISTGSSTQTFKVVKE